MAPVSQIAELTAFVKQTVKARNVMVFSKTTCPFCAKVKDLFRSLNVQFEFLELDTHENGALLQTALYEFSGQRSVPNVFINGKHLGGCDDTLQAHANNRLLVMISGDGGDIYEYNLIVVGGGSGGLAVAKILLPTLHGLKTGFMEDSSMEAASLGKKVALLDLVKPSLRGTTWGLGGTCVNVGCIPKKLMHRAAIMGEELKDCEAYGWGLPGEVKHNWSAMKDAIQDHIGSLNWGYRVQLRSENVKYINGYGTFVNAHTVKATMSNNTSIEVTSDFFVVATGERPRCLDIPGAKEFSITSDDLFSLDYCPGKTLCIGASYVSLECAGFLAGIGLPVTVMVRSILLRGFDQQCAEIVGDYMQKHGVNFVRGAMPVKIDKLEDGHPGRYRVTAVYSNGGEVVEEYNTILMAIGRDPCTQDIGLDAVGVDLDAKTGRVICKDNDQSTTVPNIYAIGDIALGRPQLTPVAIQSGRLLAKRIFSNFNILCDYGNVATTVFTPLEYGAIGYSEEDAIEKFGEVNIEVYHSNFTPLEWTVPHRAENICYGKMICVKPENERVVGFHVVGPNAGEITQGYSVAMRMGATKADFDATIGIHPTCSETFTSLRITKRSGMSSQVTGC